MASASTGGRLSARSSENRTLFGDGGAHQLANLAHESGDVDGTHDESAIAGVGQELRVRSAARSLAWMTLSSMELAGSDGLSIWPALLDAGASPQSRDGSQPLPKLRNQRRNKRVGLLRQGPDGLFARIASR